MGTRLVNRILPLISLQYTASIHTSSPNHVSIFAKKKRTDVHLLMMTVREERKRKKLAKLIAQLKEFEKKLKPIDELFIDLKVANTLPERKRELPQLSFDESERRALLIKRWSRYQGRLDRHDKLCIHAMRNSQNEALKQLRLESEHLYQAAIQIDEKLLPITFNGPVTTPPIKNFNSPDGDYIDTTKKWE